MKHRRTNFEATWVSVMELVNVGARGTQAEALLQIIKLVSGNDAKISIGRYLEINPHHADVLHFEGLSPIRQVLLDEAVESIGKAIAILI